MKQLGKYILLIISLVGISTGERVWAQTPDSLLQIAVANNQELQALRLSYQAALEKAPQVSQLPNPEVGFGAFILPVETRLGPQRARLSLTQMFPWFGTLQAQEDWAIAEARATFERIAAYELELKYRIDNAYLVLYELSASQRILQENVILLQTLKDLAETKVASGRATLADVLRLDLRLDELSQRIQLLENNKRKPQAEINQILFRDLATTVVVPDTITQALLVLDRDSLMAEVRSTHPMLRMYELQQQAAEAAIQVNTLQGRPTFGIGADYLNTGQRTDAFPEKNGRDAFQIRATISIPLYREKYEAREREESLRIDALEARKLETLSRFGAMIEMAFTDYEEARLDLALYGQQIQTIRSAIEILEADYASQAKSFDELLQLEVSLLDYQLKQLQAIVKSHTAKAAITRYLPY